MTAAIDRCVKEGGGGNSLTQRRGDGSPAMPMVTAFPFSTSYPLRHGTNVSLGRVVHEARVTQHQIIRTSHAIVESLGTYPVGDVTLAGMDGSFLTAAMQTFENIFIDHHHRRVELYLAGVRHRAGAAAPAAPSSPFLLSSSSSFSSSLITTHRFVEMLRQPIETLQDSEHVMDESIALTSRYWGLGGVAGARRPFYFATNVNDDRTQTWHEEPQLVWARRSLRGRGRGESDSIEFTQRSARGAGDSAVLVYLPNAIAAGGGNSRGRPAEQPLSLTPLLKYPPAGVIIPIDLPPSSALYEHGGGEEDGVEGSASEGSDELVKGTATTSSFSPSSANDASKIMGGVTAGGKSDGHPAPPPPVQRNGVYTFITAPPFHKLFHVRAASLRRSGVRNVVKGKGHAPYTLLAIRAAERTAPLTAGGNDGGISVFCFGWAFVIRDVMAPHAHSSPSHAILIPPPPPSSSTSSVPAAAASMISAWQSQYRNVSLWNTVPDPPPLYASLVANNGRRAMFKGDGLVSRCVGDDGDEEDGVRVKPMPIYRLRRQQPNPPSQHGGGGEGGGSSPPPMPWSPYLAPRSNADNKDPKDRGRRNALEISKTFTLDDRMFAAGSPMQSLQWYPAMDAENPFFTCQLNI